jgi:hypothetical protein
MVGGRSPQPHQDIQIIYAICWVISHTPHTKDKELCFVFTQHRFFVWSESNARGGGSEPGSLGDLGTQFGLNSVVEV